MVGQFGAGDIFAAAATDPFGLSDVGSYASPSFADLDGDGDLDAFVANNGMNEILTNDGYGNFTTAPAPGGSLASRDVALGDLDGDGDLDAFVTNSNGEPNQILTNDGYGNFTDAYAPGGYVGNYSVALGDLDGDGGIPAVNEDGLPNLGDFLFA